MKAFIHCMVLAAALSASPVSAAVAEAPASDRGLYREVYRLTEKDRFSEAEQLAMRSKNWMLAKLVRWMTYASPRSGASFEEITSFIDSSPDWPLMAMIQRRAEEAISPTTPPERVLAWFQNRRPMTSDGSMALAKALMGSGQTERAAIVARHSWIEDGYGSMQERQFLAQFSDLLKPGDHWLRLNRLLWDRQSSPANSLLLRVPAEQRMLAQARLALQNGKTNPEPALAAVPREYRDDPGLILDRIRWRRQKDLDEDAIELLSHPSRNQVRPDLWWQERNILARRALQKGLISRAYQVASDHGLDPKSPQYAEAEFLSGWIALRFLDDRETAQAHFLRLWETVSTPLSKSRAAYWAGRTAEMLKDDSGARQWYNRGAEMFTAYYGQLSASRLENHHWPLPPDPAPTAGDRERFARRELVRAIKMMFEMGHTEHLRAFFIRLNEVVDSAGERTLVGKLALDSRRNDLAVTIARRADRDGVFLVNAGWPVPQINGGSNPEQALVLALIRQESGFITDAQSPVGARGLMQLMPSTAAKVAKDLKVKFNKNKLDDPDYNVRLGRAYLADMVDDFGGSYILALAAYNAGPSRARRWIKEYGDPREPGVDVVDWIEMIPFTETRNYVQRVMESVSIYRRKLGSQVGNSFEQDLKRWARKAG